MRLPPSSGNGRAATAALVLVLAALVVAGPAPAFGFGQNKIVYDKFEWKVYKSIHFEIYYYPEEEEFLDQMISYAESAYAKISKALDHEVTDPIPIIYYKTHGEFEQTNITLEQIPEAVGAFAEPFQSRIVLPIDDPPDKVYATLTHELVHIFEYSILYGDSLRRVLRSSPPLWIMEGLASYLAQDEDSFDQMVIRDAVVNNIIPPVEQLNQLSFLTYRYGHAIFAFIEKDWGPAGIRNFLYEYRKVLLTNSVGKAIREAFGIEIDEFDRRFDKYLRQKYFPVLMEKNEPGDSGKEIGLKKPYQFTFSPTLSPSGELVAALATPKDELDVVILSANDGKLIRNLTKGFTNKYRDVSTVAFEGARDLTWSAEGDRVAFFVDRENKRDLLIYDALSGKRRGRYKINVDIPASPAFSPDGKSILFWGNRAGIFDIFRLDLDTKEIVNLTNDNYYDTNPIWSSDGKKVLYNRRIGGYPKVFLLDAEDPSRKTQLTFGPTSDLMPTFGRDGKTIYFVSDRGPIGIYNLWSLDTTTGELIRWTDLVGGAFAPVQLASAEDETVVAYAAYFRGTFRLFRMQLKNPIETIPGEQTPETVEVVPFTPPLVLTADEAEKKPYDKLKWNVDAPNINIGVADDGTVFSDTDISFTDLLGDYRVRLVLSSVDDFTNLNVSYLDLKRRFQWGAQLIDSRDFYFTTTSGNRVDRRQFSRITGVQALAQYPFSRHYRVEGSAGYFQRALDFPTIDQKTGLVKFEGFRDDFVVGGLGLSGDTTRFKGFGPYFGKRFSVDVTRGQNISGDSGSFTNYSADLRGYLRMTSRSLIAWRVVSSTSTGEGRGIQSVGGYNELRGYDFRTFPGNSIAFTNLELRFPFIDELRFPFLGFSQLRGVIFLDAGAAWFNGGLWYDPRQGTYRFNPLTYVPPDPFTGKGGNVDFIKFDAWDSENNRPQDLRATWGIGFHFLLGGLEWHFDFAHRLPYTAYDIVTVKDELTGLPVKRFDKVEVRDGVPRTNFWIGYQF